jgi:hypothetical protein
MTACNCNSEPWAFAFIVVGIVACLCAVRITRIIRNNWKEL